MSADVLLADVVKSRPLNQIEARRLIDGIRADVTDLDSRIATAYLGQAWTALGYADWDALCEAEFDGARLRVPREVRVEQVQSLRSAGLSTRAIGAALGVGKSTVDRDLASVPGGTDAPQTVQSLDGRTRPASQPPRPQASPAPASPIDQTAAATDRDMIGAGEPDITGTTLSREEFLEQRQTGEVLSPEDWQRQQQPAESQEPTRAEMTAQVYEAIAGTENTFLLNLFRGITAANQNLLALDVDRAVEVLSNNPDERTSVLAFLERVEKWSTGIRSGLRPSLRSVK